MTGRTHADGVLSRHGRGTVTAQPRRGLLARSGADTVQASARSVMAHGSRHTADATRTTGAAAHASTE
ncbi:MAG: hypothetical protein BGO26_13990 [Actinobacteria bacterium 69-20]|nr:MAG: hypothetical protein BGO26_13990 [Actinobacteria bacterium 69-20]